MNLQKVLPAAIVVTLITGAGLAHGAISLSKQSRSAAPTRAASISARSLDPDSGLKSDILHDKRSDQKDRIRGERADDRQNRASNDWKRDGERRDRDSRDRESSVASLHHDGDDHLPDQARMEFARDTRSETAREIMRGARLRVASLYSPEHHAGYHARMHRHSR